MSLHLIHLVLAAERSFQASYHYFSTADKIILAILSIRFFCSLRLRGQIQVRSYLTQRSSAHRGFCTESSVSADRWNMKLVQPLPILLF